MLRLCFFVLVCLFATGCGQSSDSAKSVDQPDTNKTVIQNQPSLAKQPKYETLPRYCVVAIGPKREKQMWMVIDDRALYIDRNANGDLTEPDERVEGAVEMSYSGTTYINYFVGDLEDESLYCADTNVRAALSSGGVRVSVTTLLDGLVQSANNSHVLQMEMEPDPAKASVIHFGGPNSIGLYEEPQIMTRGEEMKFTAMVGTPGDGVGTLTAVAHANIPEDAHPKVEFSFPHRDSGKPNIEMTTYLKGRC